MVKNFMCSSCAREAICKHSDIVYKFHEDSKKPLGINITMDSCSHFEDENPADG